MYPDVEGVDFRLGFCRFVTVLVMMVVVVVSVMVMMMGFLVGLWRVLKTGTFIMMVMMMIVVVQMLIFVHFVGLFRVLKTGTLIVVVMMVIVVMVVQVPPGERRQGHPQHHQEQSEGDVNPDIFRVRFLADGGDGASPPHLSVIHLTTPSGRGTKRQKYDSKLESFHDGAPPEKIFTRHV